MVCVSHSECAVARSCWKKYFWNYVQGLVPIRRSNALTLGTVIHKCFELHYNGMSDQDILSYLCTAYDDLYNSASQEEQEDILIDKYTAIGMWTNYPNKQLDFETIEPEMEFEVNLTPDIKIKGRLDGFVKKQDSWWVREVKTTGLSMRQFEGRMRTSYQSSGYAYAVSQMTGNEVEGIVYDVIKKPLLRKRQTENARDYCERILDDYKDPAKQRYYFSRHYTYRSAMDLRNYKEDTICLVNEIQRRKLYNEWYRNPEACWSFNCECAYAKICFSDDIDPAVIQTFYTTKVSDRDTKLFRQNDNGEGA